MSRLRVAVIGVGNLGKEHARILSALPEVELAGIADVNSEQCQAVARRLGCRAFSSPRPLLHLADAAIVVVPTIHHHAVAGEFLRCGIPLLVEKPLAADTFEPFELAQRILVIVDAQADRRIFLGRPNRDGGGLLAIGSTALKRSGNFSAKCQEPVPPML